MKKMLMATLLLVGVTGQAIAATDFYATAGVQYSRSGEPYKLRDSGYQVGGGYVINQQWSVEVNAEQLFAVQKREDGLLNKLDSDALTLSVLGKTSFSDTTMLFYRAGVSSAKHQGFYSYVMNKDTMPNDVVVTTIRANLVDENLVHALLGLGLEQNFNERWFGRAEIVHLFKKNELQADTFRLSLGYRF